MREEGGSGCSPAYAQCEKKDPLYSSVSQCICCFVHRGAGGIDVVNQDDGGRNVCFGAYREYAPKIFSAFRAAQFLGGLRKTRAHKQVFFQGKTAQATERAGEEHGLVKSAHGSLLWVHRNRNEALRPPEGLHLEKQLIKALSVERDILAPVEKFQPVDGKAHPFFVEEDSPSLLKEMRACLTVCAQLLLMARNRLAAAHAERLYDIRQGSFASPAYQILRGKQNGFADRTAGRI